MKTIIIFLFICVSTLYSYSQMQYYTTDGNNRLTVSEINEMLSQKVIKFEKLLGKKFYGSFSIIETQIKNDTIISKVKIEITDKNSEPFSEYLEKEFPIFDLTTIDNKDISLEQLKGKPTLINFWYTKCAPCIDEMTVLNKIKEKYKNDFNFIAITFDNEDDVNKFLKIHQFDFELVVNAKNFIDNLGIHTYPMNWFLDRNGIVKYVKNGISYTKDSEDSIEIGDGNEFIEIIEKLK